MIMEEEEEEAAAEGRADVEALPAPSTSAPQKKERRVRKKNREAEDDEDDGGVQPARGAGRKRAWEEASGVGRPARVRALQVSGVRRQVWAGLLAFES
jgi:hypothetical protein